MFNRLAKVVFILVEGTSGSAVVKFRRGRLANMFGEFKSLRPKGMSLPNVVRLF